MYSLLADRECAAALLLSLSKATVFPSRRPLPKLPQRYMLPHAVSLSRFGFGLALGTAPVYDGHHLPDSKTRYGGRLDDRWVQASCGPSPSPSQLRPFAYGMLGAHLPTGVRT
ncbi:hypothetical protein VPH35_076586 [Triticum aestivum]